MRNRSGFAVSEDQLRRLTLAQLNQQIAHAEWRFQNIAKSQLRKDAFKRLIWLEAHREKLHKIPAPKRWRV
jgi:hypothetical protein